MQINAITRLPSSSSTLVGRSSDLPRSTWNNRRRRGLITAHRLRRVARASADSNVAPGQVFIPFCYAEAAANVLTNPQLDPFGKIPEYKFCAAKVEPVVIPAAAE